LQQGSSPALKEIPMQPSRVFHFAAAMALLAEVQTAQASYSADFSTGVGPEWSIVTSLNTADTGILGQLQDGSATLDLFAAGPTSTSLSFDLLGFRTLDGAGNCCTDTFNLSLNNVVILSGAFDMSGGGTNTVFINSVSAIVNTVSSGYGQGGLTTVSIQSLSIVPGLNSLRFDYGMPLQGIGDESWGLDNVNAAGQVSVVPEPAGSATLLAGLLATGLWMRRRARG